MGPAANHVGPPTHVLVPVTVAFLLMLVLGSSVLFAVWADAGCLELADGSNAA